MVGYNGNQNHYEDEESEPQPGVSSRIAMLFRKKKLALAELALGSGFSLAGIVAGPGFLVMLAPGLFMIADGASRIQSDRNIIEQFKGGHIQNPIGRLFNRFNSSHEPENNEEQSHRESEHEPAPGIASRAAMILRKNRLLHAAEIAAGIFLIFPGGQLAGTAALGIVMALDGAIRLANWKGKDKGRGLIHQVRSGKLMEKVDAVLDWEPGGKKKKGGHH